MDDKLEPEFAAPFRQWKATPSPHTSGAMLRALNPVIDTALKSYGGTAKPSPTLRGRARQMTLKALNSYNPQQGTLKTHLLSQLQSLRRAAAQEQNVIPIPEQVGLDYQHLLEAENELRDYLGRDPSDSEIADHTGLSYKRLAHIRRSQGSISEGSVLSSNDGLGLPATQIPGQDQAAEAWVDFVYHDLGAVDRVIMDYSLGRNGSPKLGASEIAKRLGITPGAVSQRAAKIQQLLDARQDLGVL